MAENFAYSDYTEVVPGIISAIASAFVCLTVVMFQELRCLRYIELVFYIAINDVLASVGMALGKTPNGSAACWYQGISTNFNYLSAILWSTVITFQVWLIVCKKNVIKDLTYAHIVCWGIPLLATLLPLSTSTYANPDDESNWCFVANRSNSPQWSQLFWFIMAFYGWVWLAMIFNVIMVCGIGYRFSHMKIVPDKVLAAVRKLLLYPIIITICWVLATSVDFYSVFHPDPTTEFFYIIDGLAGVLAISQGFLFSVVFFAMNPLVRTAWADFFVKIGCCSAAPEDSAALRDDKSVSMVSVSMNGTNSSSESGSRDHRDTATHENNRRTSGGGPMQRSSITSMTSWYGRSGSTQGVAAAVQDEADYIPSPNARGAQRMSLLNFLNGEGSGSHGVARRSLLNIVSSLGMERRQSTGEANNQLNLNHSVQSNPMVSVAINDFGSVNSDNLSASQSGTGTATLSVRRAGNGEFYGSDEESCSVQSGITSATGQSGGTGTRHASVNSTGTDTTSGTKQSGKQRSGLIGFLRR